MRTSLTSGCLKLPRSCIPVRLMSICFIGFVLIPMTATRWLPISFTCTQGDWTTTRGRSSFLQLNRFLNVSLRSNFTQFYSTKSERDRNLRKEYEAQMEYRKHLQAFIDRWRYNANRAAQAQSKIKILEKVRLGGSHCRRCSRIFRYH